MRIEALRPMPLRESDHRQVTEPLYVEQAYRTPCEMQTPKQIPVVINKELEITVFACAGT